jgi:salicylate hydroxylase
MTTDKSEERLRVAIIGGGPGGLAAAIELAHLPFVDWNLYEKKLQISETGGGISVQPNTWRLLEHNGAAGHISDEDFFRPQDGLIEQRRYACHGILFSLVVVDYTN